MKYSLKKLAKWVVVGVFVLIGVVMLNVDSAMAAGYGLTVSPMSQNIVINPGDEFKTSFKISNPSGSTQDTYYKIEVEPFYISNNSDVTYKAEGDSGKIVDWVTFDVPVEGKLAPNEAKEVIFTIDVPESAPAGGQYMSVLVTSSGKPTNEEEQLENVGDNSGAMIRETRKMSHLIYAEVTGDTIKKGEIIDANLPGFLLSGNISGSALVKNQGNVHGDAVCTLKVYPLFSDEEIYSNEEQPASFLIMPDRELFAKVSWEQTPAMGIFNAVFTAEFEGESVEISKLIIVCPVWLLFIIIFAIFALIIYFVVKAKARGKATKKAEKTA